MNQIERIQYLADRVLQQEASQAELEELSGILDMGNDNTVQLLEQLITVQLSLDRHPLSEDEIRRMSTRILQMDIPEDIPVVEMRRVPFLRKWWWAAASVILLLGIGTYLWVNKNNSSVEAVAKNKIPIQPGKSGAVLTLADGQQVLLDSAGNGVIAIQQGSKAVMQDGQLSYQRSEGKTAAVEHNTMSTPRGRQFRLSLPDGTQVWLNSASSIRYPTIFTGTDRKVEITGEAYFEVAQKASQPFFVKAADRVEVQVLGTHFNINAYDNETALNTTLLEGSVKVNGALLKPGQQAKILNNGPAGAVQVEYTDISKVMAWKNGRFNFEGATIEEIMRQIERWYDVEVVYKGKKPRVEFEGKMTMDVSLDGLIVLMEKANIHLRLEGRTLTVLP
ncbi:FecR family protein [Pseudoflavitalea rhizosphaerae]|uniref:FecR family protein n=1 Tax=Pseudoflavitalea rhizosphaerae TaxID=1884793 RepID=UPI000F8C8D87|nr:FecR family protein [Pseudoflavitalea rhizosphaerae]